MIDYISVFIFLFAVIDPIGTVPVFLAVTARHSEREKRKIALIATLAAAGILIFFVVVGEIILTAMNIPLSAFQIAGGIILFLFALSMIFGESKPEQEVKLATNVSETAIFPLAIPSIASPGAMLAAVLLTENAKYSIFEQLQVTGTLLVVLLIALILMLGASRIHRVIGNSGASVISRVMGLILASVATANTLEGIKMYFAL
ncbi:MarC family protein [Moritella sp. Urea-trap-13]|uniref:MarC family protein n=1 Tax=Moritella sp. Urea-trap-13 TaxID=2058327 RepID=UPI000C32B1BE|nr:MarC family protein [Moritella sp. Urea-trap-13]PKH09306.1 MarC family transcriptional regulator [Moritella sp. Urea-trap-13]